MAYRKSFGLRVVGTVLAFLGASLSVSAGPPVSIAAVAPSRVLGDWRQSPSVLVAHSEPTAARLDTAVDDAAPDAKLVALDGSTFHLHDRIGRRPLVLVFGSYT